MVKVRRTGRTPNEIIEVAPSECPNGHPLGDHQVLVGYGAHPDGGRRRTWTCRTCGVVIWDDVTSAR